MYTIISIGGSLIAPQDLDVKFLKKLRALLIKQIRRKFVLIPGGGYPCRHYQRLAQEITPVRATDLDWIGIAVNRVHSYLLRAVFGKLAHSEVLSFQGAVPKIKKKIIVALGGVKPGWSSDSTAVAFAKKLGAKVVVNLTNVNGVYDRDPHKFRNAKLIPRLTWAEFGKQFGTSRKPGQHKPFDPSIVSLARKMKLKVVILNGRDLKNFQKFLDQKPFLGTTIDG